MEALFPRLAQACDLLASRSVDALAMVCIALGAVLLALVALGFGPLRARLAPTASYRPPRARGADWDGGLLSTWNLYRQLRHTRTHHHEAGTGYERRRTGQAGSAGLW